MGILHFLRPRLLGARRGLHQRQLASYPNESEFQNAPIREVVVDDQGM
jgi:hypothetical protein